MFEKMQASLSLRPGQKLLPVRTHQALEFIIPGPELCPADKHVRCTRGAAAQHPGCVPVPASAPAVFPQRLLRLGQLQSCAYPLFHQVERENGATCRLKPQPGLALSMPSSTSAPSSTSLLDFLSLVSPARVNILRLRHPPSSPEMMWCSHVARTAMHILGIHLCLQPRSFTTSWSHLCGRMHGGPVTIQTQVSHSCIRPPRSTLTRSTSRSPDPHGASSL
ncbi:PREDICTED: uncharacterized protein LOC102018897 [Chinchilla lanigera]|uniref:uncharacterized protein LOC102018897 n=1 Tax=Chinchilla lanigera TaxID=34839 RepID=UPI00038EB17D|nr:PREDICTED: uncharacterized protein LOC102018897 [Chinchilla lanigera]